MVQQTLEHWQADPDLAGVRDADALAKLPEAERRRLAVLWAEVDALLARPGAATLRRRADDPSRSPMSRPERGRP